MPQLDFPIMFFSCNSWGLQRAPLHLKNMDEDDNMKSWPKQKDCNLKHTRAAEPRPEKETRRFGNSQGATTKSPRFYRHLPQVCRSRQAAAPISAVRGPPPGDLKHTTTMAPELLNVECMCLATTSKKPASRQSSPCAGQHHAGSGAH